MMSLRKSHPVKSASDAERNQPQQAIRTDHMLTADSLSLPKTTYRADRMPA